MTSSAPPPPGVEDEPPHESEPPPSKVGGGPRQLFAALFNEAAAPLDLRIVGRVIIHATLVGAAAGLVACGFYWLLEVGQQLCIDVLTGYETLRAAGELIAIDHLEPQGRRPWLLWLVPAVGAFLASLLCRTYAPECAGAGADAVIRAFHQKVSDLRRRVMFVKPLASVLTLATGGAGGREGPTMQIGGAIGSAVGRLLDVSVRERRILLVAGMAAGTSAIFRTPLGAALLSVEVLYRDDFEADGLVPAVLASVVGYSVFISVYGEATLFETAAEYPFVIGHLPLYGIMTLLLAGAGALFVKALREVEARSERLPPWARAGAGGLAVGILATVMAVTTRPEAGESVLGGGYGAAQAAITGAPWLGEGMAAVGVLALMAVLKMLACALTVGTGGSAGTFAPTLAVGALLGGSFGRLMQVLLDDPTIQPGAFALVGMGVLFGGIAHTPLGALVMVCEMAGSYDLLVPLMLGEGIAFVALRRWSLYRAQPDALHDSPAHPPRILELLSNLRVKEVMVSRDEYESFGPGTPVTAMMQAVSRTGWQDVFPVLDGDGQLLGMITPELLRILAAERQLEPWIVAVDAMQPALTVGADDDLRTASKMMLTHGIRELLVVDEGRRIIGFIDEADVSQVYLQHLTQ